MKTDTDRATREAAHLALNRAEHLLLAIGNANQAPGHVDYMSKGQMISAAFRAISEVDKLRTLLFSI